MNQPLVIDQKKVEEAGAILKQIINLVMQYQKVFMALNPPEQNLSGGFLISVYCPAQDLAIGASLSPDSIVLHLHNEISVQVQKRMEARYQKPKAPPNITPVTGGKLEPN